MKRLFAIFIVAACTAPGYCAPVPKEIEGDWIASDYIYPVAHGKNLFNKYTGDAAFGLRTAAKGGEMFQTYNFHESCTYSLAKAEKNGDEYRLYFSTDAPEGLCPADTTEPTLLRVLETDKASRPEVVLRRNPMQGGLRWRVYTRVSNGKEPNASKAIEDIISQKVLGGTYKNAQGTKIKFSGEGKGRWGKEPFEYLALADYVLGPACNLVYFKSGKIPFSGIVAFGWLGGNLVLLDTPENPNTAAGIDCGTKVLAELIPQGTK